ncbi:MAG: histidine kinase dimerization/phospho-acceptor domain-containing protein [Chloroflexota bacterium]
MMAQLPIRKLTLWKQGIGYFERRGQVTENLVRLVLPRAATNDVLKSLTITAHDGGQVLSVEYETPEDKVKLLNELSIRLRGQADLVDLVESLRGSRVKLTLTGDSTVTGRVIGIEKSLSEGTPLTILQSDEGDRVLMHPVTQLQGIQLLDDRSRSDVSFFLDVSQTEQTRTTLTVQLAPGEHDLEISHLAPSPIWRMSYRLARTDEQHAILTAWGIFENSLDEDLEEVSLTLVSGRPISFVYDLYESRTPPRPEVTDDTSGLEQMSGDPRMMEAMSAISHELRTPLSSITGFADLLNMDGSLTKRQQEYLNKIKQGVQRMGDMVGDLLSMVRLRDQDDSTQRSDLASYYRSGPLGDLRVSGRYFTPMLMNNTEPAAMTYQVSTPISVKRGQSAMVPILSATVEVHTLCVYNGDKMPNHPLSVWDLRNTTGFALEQGPVTILDGGYAGEGLLRFVGAGDTLQIPYALEFGILVAERIEQREQTLFEVVFPSGQNRALVRRAQITDHFYTLTNRVERAVRVDIEQRDPNNGSYFEMPPPAFAEAGHSRWSVEVLPRQQAEYAIHIRRIFETPEDVAQWRPAFVEDLHEASLINQRVYDLLQALASQQEQARTAGDEMKTLQAEQESIQLRQDQFRKNLSALGASEREVNIRNQILTDLETSENRRREIDARIRELRTQQENAQRRQQEIVVEIFSG